MKLSNLLKSLDVRGIAKDLQYLFERIDDNFAKVKGAFDNRISLMDNIECDIVEGVFDSGKEYAVRLKNLSTAKGAIVLSSTAPCIATPVVKTAAGAAKITLFFAQMASGVRATIVLFPYGVGGNQTNSLLATTTTPGLIQPDGTTVTIDDAGVISSAGGASVITTEGDLIIGDVAGNESRLPIGATPGDVLTSDGTTASWAPVTGASGTLIHTGTTTINFGAFPGTCELSFTVVDASITATCAARAALIYLASVDHTVEDHAYAARFIDITCLLAAGVATFYIRSSDQLQGVFNIKWEWYEPNGGGGNGVNGPWSFATKPATPDARDEEFEGDLSAWTLNAGMTASAPDMWAAPGAGVIKYSINGAGPSVGGRPSHLVLQPVSDGAYRVAIEKAVTFNTNDVIVMRVGTTRDQPSGGTANNDYSCGLLIGQTAAGVLDTANCTKLFITETDAGVVDIQWEKVVAGVPTTAVFNLAVTFAAMPTDIAIVKRTNDYYFYMRFGHAWLRLGAFNAGIAPNRVGVHCANNSTLYSLHYIDFIRFFANTGNLP